MNSRPLIIGEEVQAEIKAAVERARAKPLPIADLMRVALPDKEFVSLADRRPGSERSIASENVLIPFGYRAAISFEEQPAGIVRHLSVSVEAKGRVPSIPAVELIAKEFGFTKLDPATTRIWVEEFDPGHVAVNVVQIAAPAQGGNA